MTMLEEVNIQRRLSELGLKQNEIDSLELKDAIQSLRAAKTLQSYADTYFLMPGLTSPPCLLA
jgi:hypothetical protein